MRPLRREIRAAIEAYRPINQFSLDLREEKGKEMKEITNLGPVKWEKLTGELIKIEGRETQYGHQSVCSIRQKSGSIMEVYMTQSMSNLTERYIGWQITLVRKPLPDGKSRIHVYIDEDQPPSDPFEGE
jgi:hypothetical protein